MSSLMLKETLETASVLKSQWNKNTQNRTEICEAWKKFNPYSFLTIARGSSDHAAQYFNYLVGLKLGKLTTSFTPSLISIHKSLIDASQTVSIGVSQSGRSPDLVQSFSYFKQKNFETLAMVNVEESPLAQHAKYVYPLYAGEEKSVAATKSFIASLFASASLIAKLSNDTNLLHSLENHHSTMVTSTDNSWIKIVEALKSTQKAMIVGRGLGLSIALEAALKLKETCHIQAEAFSSAEILHGPQAVIEEQYPLIIFALRGPSQKSLFDLAAQMKQRGANVVVISDHKDDLTDCLYSPSLHSDLDALNAIHQFYIAVNDLAKVKRLNPDSPRSLSKVTLTL